VIIETNAGHGTNIDNDVTLVTIGNNDRFPADAWNGETVALFIFGHRFTAAEHKAFAQNIWQVIEPRVVLVPMTAAAPIEEIIGDPGIVEGSITFSTDVDQILGTQLNYNVATTFLINLAKAQASVKTTSNSGNFDITLDQQELNVASRPATFSAQIDLTQLESNQADLVSEYVQSLALSQQESNVKITSNAIQFDIDLDYQVLNQLAANVTLNLNTELNMLQTGDAGGPVLASISFVVNMQQAETNTITADKAATFLMNMAQQQSVQLDKVEALVFAIQASDTYTATRTVPGNVGFGAEFDQLQSNTLDKVLLMSFNALMDKNFNTAGSIWGQTVNFASALAYNFATEGDISALITFSTDLGITQQSNKISDVSMGFNVDADIITEIHLIVEGNVSFSSIMEQTEAKQLLGQSGITFGHIAGLASIGSADLGADITMGIIQGVQVNGFTIIFEIVTPDERILKIEIEDRTTLIGGSLRTLRINKT